MNTSINSNIDIIDINNIKETNVQSNSTETNKNISYYKLHKKDWNVRKVCEVCGKTYTRNSRSSHVRTDKHLRAKELAEKNTQIDKLENELNELKNLNEILKIVKLK